MRTKIYIDVIDALIKCKKVKIWKIIPGTGSTDFRKLDELWNFIREGYFLWKWSYIWFYTFRLSNIVRKKHNILCKYLIVKRVFRKYPQMLDCNKAKYVNIKYNNLFLLKKNWRLSAANLKCNFCYKIFIDMEFEKPLYETKWSKMFNIVLVSEKESWRSKCTSKMYMYKKCIAVYNYKLLHGVFGKII